MEDFTIVYPDYFRIFECKAGRWFIKDTKPFVTNSNKNPENIETFYNITEKQVVIELFRINGGKAGYYLANFRDKKYYYCIDRRGVKEKLLELGIGRKDPIQYDE